MAYFRDPLVAARFQPDETHDPGLLAFLRRVYLKLAAGLALSAAIAWAVVSIPAVRDLLFTTPFGAMIIPTSWGLTLVLAPLVIMLVSMITAHGPSARGSGLLYWAMAASVGGSLSVLAITFTSAELESTFLVSACCFAGLTVWGLATGLNLGGLHTFLVAALFGLVAALVVSLFLPDSGGSFWLDMIGVLVFSGLIATDTQQLKSIYYRTEDSGMRAASSNYGALTLYLNFVNLFESLLSLSRLRLRR